MATHVACVLCCTSLSAHSRSVFSDILWRRLARKEEEEEAEAISFSSPAPGLGDTSQSVLAHVIRGARQLCSHFSVYFSERTEAAEVFFLIFMNVACVPCCISLSAGSRSVI